MSDSVLIVAGNLCWGSDVSTFVLEPSNNIQVPMRQIWETRKQDDCYWVALLPPISRGIAGLVGTVAGICFLRGFEGDWYEKVFGMVVREQYRKLGIGTLLLQTAYVEACYRKLPLIRLHVHPDNKNAVSLYTKFGFIKHDTRTNGEWIMRKSCVQQSL